MADQQEPNCPACHKLFNVPKILPCAHTACKGCVVASLRKKTANAGKCPLPQCKTPIWDPDLDPLTSNQGQGQGQHQQDDPETLVDSTLITDVFTESLVKAHQIVQEESACDICSKTDPASESSYCLECQQKLCGTCSGFHGQFRGTRDHKVHLLGSINVRDLAQELVASFQAPCQNHADRKAESYCQAHGVLVCADCAQDSHDGCAQVKVTEKVVKDKKSKLDDLLQTWKAKVGKRKATFEEQRTEVTQYFDDLEQQVKKRKKELLASLKREEKSSTKLMTSHLDVMEKVHSSPCQGGAVVQVVSQLQARSSSVERQCQQQNAKVKVVRFDNRKCIDVKTALSQLGVLVDAPLDDSAKPTSTSTQKITTPGSAVKQKTSAGLATATVAPSFRAAAATTATTPTTATTSGPTSTLDDTSSTKPTSTPICTLSPTPTPTKRTYTKKTPAKKPTGAKLAKALKVGDRVKLTEDYIRRFGDRGCGTVTATPSVKAAEHGEDAKGFVDVAWDGGILWYYKMGCSKEYQLELL